MRSLEFRIYAPPKRDKRGKIKQQPWAGTNELIKANRSGYIVGNKLKHEYTELARKAAEEAVKLASWEAPECACDICLLWEEPHGRRDPDNIYGGAKFVLDGMVLAGVLKNDTQKYIYSLTNKIVINREHAGVTVFVRTHESSDDE